MPVGMLAAVLFIGLLMLVITLVLSMASRHFIIAGDTPLERVNDLLPQTQCGQCGYPGCRPYATAIIHEGVPLNRCPPGGEATIFALSELLNRTPTPLDPHCGVHVPPMIAVIDENACIGCVLCLQACPVDAILGARRYMHTVIERECTGCELCITPCPVDCIQITARA